MLLKRSLCTIAVLIVTVLHASAASDTTSTSTNLSHDPNNDHNSSNDAIVIEQTADHSKKMQRLLKAAKSTKKATKAPKSGTKSLKQPKKSGKNDKEKRKMLTGQYIIRLSDDMPSDMVESAVNELLGKIESLVQRTTPNVQVQLGHIYMNTIKGFSISNFPDNLASSLLTLPGVIKIEQDYEANLDLPPQDNSTSTYTDFNSTYHGDRNLQSCVQDIPWGITRVGGPIYRTSNRRVFVIDSGIAPFYSELNIDTSRSRDFTGTGSWRDDYGHGTHVAGTIAGKCSVLGVVPGATVVAIKVFDRYGNVIGNSILAGLDYAGKVAVAGDVINLSLRVGADSAFDNAVINLAGKGIKFAIAAGNDGINAALVSPARANHVNVYTVSAMDFNGRLAVFSNYGSPPIDYAAPGVSIVSLGHKASGAVLTMQGTSMAAPHVAGLIFIGDVTSRGVVWGDKDTTPDPIAYKKETGTKLGDWALCSSSSQCSNGCCSGRYSGGTLKCTPLGPNFDFFANGCVSPRRLRGIESLLDN